jgi:cytochrome d ubiquinol oxidase subunit I
MEFDAFYLSRLQFGFTTAFHIMFPTLTIGLGAFLVIMEAMWMRTGQEVYFRLYRLWVKIFALAFGVGVVSGIVLSFEFGLNFSEFSNFAGDVLGPLLGYEVLTAFFLEAGFLGIMLFGWRRVGPGLHFLATILVAVGTTFSAFWILSANSWMQSPQGYEIGPDGLAEVKDWVEVIFNPTFPDRLMHMVNASFTTATFVVAGVSAWYLLRGQHIFMMRRAFSIAIGLALLLAPLQVFLGDQQGLNTLEHQPVKIAAIEGHWETKGDVPLILFAWPNMAEARNDYAVQIPYLGSLILTHSLDGQVQGLTSVAAEDRPYVPIVFFAFRIMVAIGFVMIAVAVAGAWLRHKGRLYDSTWFLTTAVWVAPLGFVATICGWIVTETGRQPWVVYNVMRTADGLTPSLDTSEVAFSLIVLLVVYAVLLVSFLYYLAKLIRQGPDLGEPLPHQAQLDMRLGAHGD